MSSAAGGGGSSGIAIALDFGAWSSSVNGSIVDDAEAMSESLESHASGLDLEAHVAHIAYGGEK